MQTSEAVEAAAPQARTFSMSEVCDILENHVPTKDASSQYQVPVAVVATQTDNAEGAQSDHEVQCELAEELRTQREVHAETQTDAFETEGQSEQHVEIVVETPRSRPQPLELNHLPDGLGCVNQTPLPEELA